MIMLDHPAVRYHSIAVISDKKSWTHGHDIAKNCEPQKKKVFRHWVYVMKKALQHFMSCNPGPLGVFFNHRNG